MIVWHAQGTRFKANFRWRSLRAHRALPHFLPLALSPVLSLTLLSSIFSLANPPIGPPVDPAFKAKQDELHERIIQILNKPAPIKEVPKPQPQVALAPELNASLQRAIDSLIKTGPNLLSQMNKGPSSATGSHSSQPSNAGGGSGGGGYQYSSYGRDSF